MSASFAPKGYVAASSVPASAIPANSIVDRHDPRFETLKRGQNLRFPATDAEAAGQIIICSSAEETASALERAVSAGLRPTIRSGGHCYEDFVANNPNGVILDLSTLNSVDADPAGGFHIAPGAVLGEAYRTLYKRYGVTLPAGTCYMVGAGGHISGGGYGLLSRLHGLTTDWLTGIDILTVDSNGKVTNRHIDAHHDPDLFRACRGAGGGNFGVITNFHFAKLPAAPSEVAHAGISFSWASMTEAKFTQLLIAFGDYWATRGLEPDTWGLFAFLSLNPGEGFNIHTQFINPDGTANDLSVLHEFFDRFAKFEPDPPETSAHGAPGKLPRINLRPWLNATLAEGGSGGGYRAKYKSAYMKQTFTPAECAAIYKYLNSPGIDAHGSFLSIDSYGGAINRPERILDTATAQRSSIMKLQWQCYWRGQDEDAGRIKFMDEFFTAVYTGPHVGAEYQGTPLGPQHEGCYMNYADVDMLRYPFWPQLFYGTGSLYPFLKQVKQRYDPNNIFHSSMSVRA
ncbi:FAD/FMN-containing dehydrogenase [Silvibacterium bohemicum]|uniref:FAD/FMN-containing dehydrogenase n=1 Tax=Silvibacterium bohemicum TaxID=1577686 RepID=A0A841JX75_9BACT|nr:FAD-binding oxidoreductase [Silvibacterium bohemicum]MBB6142604.1 FAD/FMN-containing dehydrogenase [Silvibacterium bohemicum]